ncbi:MAG: glutaminase [Cyanobacteria bacterium CAN_BIN43]|nr:glutaminase [Cyanobacteria bacterium CAN_BIN43]
MSKLAALTQSQLDHWIAQALLKTHSGHLPRHIPLLANPDRHREFTIQVRRIDEQTFSGGVAKYHFPFMSLIKPFVMLYLLQQSGHELVLSQVDVRPSEYPFNSLAQLEADQSKPRNPMINSGAIALAALLPGETASSRCHDFCQWLNQRSGSQLTLDHTMLESVESLPNPINQAIAHVLNQAGYLDSIETTLDTYQQICCLSGTVGDLTKLGLLLAKPHVNLEPMHQRMVNALMLTCGLYEESGRYAVQIGLPIKSGVSGGLLAIVPGEGAIACYSPPLDRAGNSVAGLFLLEQLAQTFNLSVFN